MGKISPLLFVLISVTSIARAQSLSDADVKNLLARVAERRTSAPDVRADFQEQKTMHLLNKPIVSSGKIWFHAPNKFRREVTGNSPSVTVSNGRDLWIYYPDFKSAEHYSLGKRSPVDAAIAAINTALNLENVENTFRITGTKIDSGYALQLLPRSPSMKRMFQKFDLRLNSDLVAERTDMVQTNGDQIVTTYSNQTRAMIPASTFEFTPPAGTAISTPLGR
ncbi:MAG: outer membrane lipoprotein carrier protein LolA [Verrucomicrobiota bacterium]|nr:outer membrane lipoprotein carrier protein LolA [Verrucomicrobiota bacterium]